MLRSLRMYSLSAVLALSFTNVGFATRANAQTYQIDCAILLCLSGGWPASVPCARARAEFIRRITPWPIEPPLQIWRCPMGASFQAEPTRGGFGRIYDILSDELNDLPLQSFPRMNGSIAPVLENAILRRSRPSGAISRHGFEFQLIQDRADIDISGPEFNFVRSIRVFDVRYARQVEAGSEGDCERSANIFIGTYGTQGDFAWARASPSALPPAHVGLEGWGSNCPNIYHRSVFVEWRDYGGSYGFEQVNY
ncbi:hypothetical protein C1J03_24540 (plasmid) [Sulfitobacter sp. SK012]|nr:hypothetical protein [Sulfitobacter sp. SK012]AXI49278.1 hypothetical protein C1J03_24540 [Sulfitobacter sp. SK012]